MLMFMSTTLLEWGQAPHPDFFYPRPPIGGSHCLGNQIPERDMEQQCTKWVLNTCRTRPKSLEWCARLIRSLYWFSRLIWIGFLDFWVDWTDLVHLIGWLNEWIKYIISVDACPISCISWLQISVITPESKYLMVADFLRYFAKTTI